MKGAPQPGLVGRPLATQSLAHSLLPTFVVTAREEGAELEMWCRAIQELESRAALQLLLRRKTSEGGSSTRIGMGAVKEAGTYWTPTLTLSSDSFLYIPKTGS